MTTAQYKQALDQIIVPTWLGEQYGLCTREEAVQAYKSAVAELCERYDEIIEQTLFEAVQEATASIKARANSGMISLPEAWVLIVATIKAITKQIIADFDEMEERYDPLRDTRW